MTFFARTRRWLRRMAHSLWSTVKRKRYGYGISIVVPYRDGGCEHRNANYQWLHEYYTANLPGAQWVQGHTDAVPYNKSAAVNNGYHRTHGDIIVVLDADAFLDTQALLDAAAEIREARRNGHKLWIMPYRRLYRLTQTTTRSVLNTAPTLPWALQYFSGHFSNGDAAPECLLSEYENHGKGSMHGHMFGALVQVHPREAFEATGGWDDRFHGWGGEDISFARAVDTLYGRHISLNYPVYHLWHPQLPAGSTQWATSRRWEGQTDTNEMLAQRYYEAYNDYDAMRELTDEA